MSEGGSIGSVWDVQSPRLGYLIDGLTPANTSRLVGGFTEEVDLQPKIDRTAVIFAIGHARCRIWHEAPSESEV